ncbi:MAG: M4 family metallopeptidase [Vicinamibacterales bacterium]
MKSRVRAGTFLAVALVSFVRPVDAQPRMATVLASEPAQIRAWDSTIDAQLRRGDLEVRRADADSLIDGRTHTRLRQLYRGVPVVGGELARQTDAAGITLSIFGSTYADIDIDVTPAIDAARAAAIVGERSGETLGPERMPELCIVPMGDGYHLAYRATVFTPEGATAYTVDARDGSILRETDGLRGQSAVGSGTGVLGDAKKMSVTLDSGTYTTRDPLRPPLLTTYNLRENLQRTIDFLNGRVTLGVSDRASDTDNVWTDSAAVDAHAQTGYFYDYYFKRFGRRGLDDNNLRLLSVVHPVPRASVLSQTTATINTYYLNAFYAGFGVMVYGEGLPANMTAGGQRWNYLAGALDVVAHELTHGVTEYTSDLLYEFEPGALNESFSDMMGTAVEFFYQQPGSGSMTADYLIAEDVVTPGGIRSMGNPAAYRPTRSLFETCAPADHERQRRRAHELRHPQSRVLPRDRGGHQPHVRTERAGSRSGEPRADREGDVSRLHADDAVERNVRRRASRHDPGGYRSLWREQRGGPRTHAGLDRGGCGVIVACMRILVVGALALAFAGDANAQSGSVSGSQSPTPARPSTAAPPVQGPERLRLVMNGGLQLGRETFAQNFPLTRNVENAPVTTDMTMGVGRYVDGGARVRVTQTLSVGATVFVAASKAHGTIAAQIPHPFYFNQPRAIAGDLSDLSRLERGVHVELAYPVSTGRGREITVFGGPSFINLRQALVTDVSYTETYPFDSATYASATTTTVSRTSPGVNVGADVTWRLNRSVRVGALIRYSYARIDMEAASGNAVPLRAGGLQIAGGLRIPIQKRPPRPRQPARPSTPRR